MNCLPNNLSTINGALLLVHWLKQRQVHCVFLIPGAQIAPLLDALAATDHIQTIIANHELGAAYMADGYARATQKTAICLSIGGPGASNLLTAAITARLDNSRVLFMTGNVPFDLQGIGAFQDGSSSGCGDSELFSVALHHSFPVSTAETLITQLDKAWDTILANNSPAHISVPKNVLDQPLMRYVNVSTKSPCEIPTIRLQTIFSVLNKAQKILIIAGQRLYNQESAKLLMDFCSQYNLPIVTTFGAKGIIAETFPLNFGNFGYGGNACANSLVFNEEIDVLLILGTDLNEKDSLRWDKRLDAPSRRLIRIDSLPTPAFHPYQPDLEIITDCYAALQTLCTADSALSALNHSANDRLDWISTLESVRHPDRILKESRLTPVISLTSLIQTLQCLLPDDSILVADAGLHRQFAGEHWRVKQPNTFYNAASVAPMGWGIAAAIGIQLAKSKQQVIALTGDGCMRMHGIELATAARYHIPVLFIICNNAAYACTGSHLKPNTYSMLQLPSLDWVGFAAAMGVKGIKVDHVLDLEKIIKRIQPMNEPFVIEVITPSLALDEPID